ncbi:hypothetical protein FLONG3_7963 [Fusarium longipes]|uniref:F-box domain-containing protein n=1 Tax=Fusarium longipes TaxID=694270 RepID=A0A395S9V0_9HYPO|nr:hypothetical protein FLONG3_7963 [Fusarium longipes]
MALRRSARLAGIEPPDAEAYATYDLRSGPKKRKITIDKKRVPKSGGTKTKSYPNDRPQLGEPAPEDALSVLPAEIQLEIIAHISDRKSMINMARTSKRYYSLVMPVIYEHVSVDFRIPNGFSRVLKPLDACLSIAQKRKLRKLAKYKGRLRRFYYRLNPDVIPSCAQSMAHSIVALKKLKSLSLGRVSCFGRIRNTDAVKILSQLHSLEHLSITNTCDCFASGVTLQTMLMRSSMTLESMEIDILSHPYRCLTNPNGFEAGHPNPTNQPLRFPALKSLLLIPRTMRLVSEDGDFMLPSLNAVDFSQLRELHLLSETDQSSFLKSLEESFSRTDRRLIRLRDLLLSKAVTGAEQHSVTSDVEIQGICQFLASFDTLRSLEIGEIYQSVYNKVVDDTGIPQQLSQTITQHKDLESLRFTCLSLGSNPLVSTKNMEVFTKNLPQLRVLDLPMESVVHEGTELLLKAPNFDGIARAICYSNNLESLSLSSNHLSQRDSARVLCIVVERLLHLVGDSEDFTWENTFKLSHITVGSFREFTVGSNLKHTEGLSYPVKVNKDGKSVWFQSELKNFHVELDQRSL